MSNTNDRPAAENEPMAKRTKTDDDGKPEDFLGDVIAAVWRDAEEDTVYCRRKGPIPAKLFDLINNGEFAELFARLVLTACEWNRQLYTQRVNLNENKLRKHMKKIMIDVDIDGLTLADIGTWEFIKDEKIHDQTRKTHTIVVPLSYEALPEDEGILYTD
jgi:hypothetical protein